MSAKGVRKGTGEVGEGGEKRRRKPVSRKKGWESAEEDLGDEEESGGEAVAAITQEGVNGTVNGHSRPQYGRIPRPALDLFKKLFGLGDGRADDSAAAGVIYARLEEKAGNATENDVLAEVMVCHLQLKCRPEAAAHFLDKSGVPKRIIGGVVLLSEAGALSFQCEVVKAWWARDEKIVPKPAKPKTEEKPAAEESARGLGTLGGLGKIPKRFPVRLQQ